MVLPLAACCLAFMSFPFPFLLCVSVPLWFSYVLTRQRQSRPGGDRRELCFGQLAVEHRQRLLVQVVEFADELFEVGGELVALLAAGARGDFGDAVQGAVEQEQAARNRPVVPAAQASAPSA